MFPVLSMMMSVIHKSVCYVFVVTLGLFVQQLMADDKPVYKTVDWTELMPASDFEALSNPPSYITEAEDDIFSNSSATATVIEYGDEFATETPRNDPYQQALVSTKIVPEMDGQPIRIPGYIVPLEFDDELTVTEFFLVPYFGACIHVPPPPPNQMIYVTYPEGIKLNALNDPFWISGRLETDGKINELGASAYSMRMHEFEDFWAN